MKVYCKFCNNELSDENWYLSHKKSGTKKCKTCANTISNIHNKKISTKLKNAKRRLSRKIKLFEILGNKCECCEITHINLLSVDHILGNGSSHRKELNISAGQQFYSWLMDNLHTKDQYRLLCFNCNSNKEFNIRRKIA